MPRRRQREEEPKSDNEETPLLSESGMTEDQRRQIRKKQRELLKEMEEKDALDLDEARDRNNKIFKEGVRFTREAVLDGENLTAIATKASRQCEILLEVRNESIHSCRCQHRSLYVSYLISCMRLLQLLLGPSIRRGALGP